jgi:hypothetical protein
MDREFGILAGQHFSLSAFCSLKIDRVAVGSADV